MRLAKALMTLALFRPAAPQTLRFADVTWGDAPATVERKLRAGGFAPGHIDDEGDMPFHGRVAGYEGDGWIYFANGRAVKTLFVVRPTPDQALGTYDRMRATLLREHGPTRHQVALYTPPFAKGDGHDLDAVRAGKLYIATVWRDGPDDRPLQGSDPGIILHVTRDLTVNLAFEGPGWTAETARRRAAGQR